MALVDLDELILRCRTDNSKMYINEAVSCYKTRAYRSAIVATWIAVCFDLLDKIRELDLSGDKEAGKQIADYERIRKSEDLSAALKFERTLLDVAKDKFEFLSQIEYIDLKRLQEDRNRCAHPSLTVDENTYTPSGELARAHIHSAVVHLLQYPPAQGKIALKKIIDELESQYFPDRESEIVVRFKQGPIKKARFSLIRNLLVILIKRSISNDESTPNLKFWRAINAIHKLHPESTEKVIQEYLSPHVRNIDDRDLVQPIYYLSYAVWSWSLLDNDVQDRLQRFSESLPHDLFSHIDRIYAIPYLRDVALSRIRKSSFEELKDNIAVMFPPPVEVYDRIVELYVDSVSFAEANSRGKLITELAKEISAQNVRDILSKGGENYQITGSNQIGLLLRRLKDTNTIDAAEFDDLFAKANFETL